MIEESIIHRLQRATCAVGYLKIPYEQFAQEPNLAAFRIVGSGFLVKDDVAMTNRHVVQGLVQMQKKDFIPDDQRALLFVSPLPNSEVIIALTRITDLMINDHEDIDIGLIDFVRRKDEEFEKNLPAKIASTFDYHLTEKIAAIGYPYGEKLMEKRDRIYRWGPVIQQGYVSAISPFQNTKKPNQLLLDLRIAGGMSGSPVFRPSNGEIIGILHSAWEATTALGFPLAMETIEKMLSKHDKVSQSK